MPTRAPEHHLRHPTLVADVKVVDDARRQVTSLRSGIDGHFQISLAPGTYVLVPVNPTANTPPGAAPVTITVVAGRYSVVDIQYDTGIYEEPLRFLPAQWTGMTAMSFS